MRCCEVEGCDWRVGIDFCDGIVRWIGGHYFLFFFGGWLVGWLVG